MSLAFGVLAILAAGGGAHGDELGFSADPNALKLTLWTLLTFVCVLVILWKFAWGPILQALKQREDGIRHDIESAQQERSRAEDLKGNYEKKLEQARDEVVEIVAEGKRDATRLKDDLLAEARTEAAAIKTRAQRETDLAEAAAFERVWDTAAELSTHLAGRVIGRELSASDHQALIAEVISQYRDALAAKV